MTSFSGLYLAGTALRTASYGLQIVGQNIANAQTPGYTRQAVEQQAIDATPGVPSIFSGRVPASGVEVADTARLSDPVLAARYRGESARSGLADTTASQLSQIEALFDEPSDSGLAEQLNDYWNAWGSVANDPGAMAPRTVLLQRAGTVAATFNALSTSLGNVTTATAQALQNDVGTANTAAGQLATLNGQIAVAKATGADANELLDQRDVLLGKLSSLVGAVTTIQANGMADVQVGGQSLVSATTASSLAVAAGSTITVNGTAVTLTGGSSAAEVQALTTTIPGYQSRIDAVADALRDSSNTAQAAGYDLTGAGGTALFAGSGAAGITVAITDPRQIAAASTAGATLDGANALTASQTAITTGSPDSLYTALVADIGGASSLAQQQQATQDTVTKNVQSQLTSVTGVSTDEEVSAMLTYQRAYQAASRVLTTVDDMLDTLINHTGVVGRA